MMISIKVHFDKKIFASYCRGFYGIFQTSKNVHYETIISFIDPPPDVEFGFVAFKLACFNVSFTSRRNSDKFWLNLQKGKEEIGLESECKINTKSIDLLVAIFHWQISLNIFHQIVKPNWHYLLLIEWLHSNNVIL